MPNEWGLTNWPPADAPPWPDWSMSDWRVVVESLAMEGWTLDPPTPAERNKYFKDALDGDGHPVKGIMAVSPSGTRYPFATCTVPAHRELLVLWRPYSCGSLAGWIG